MELLLKIKTSKATKYVVGLAIAILVATGVITTEQGQEIMQYLIGACF